MAQKTAHPALDCYRQAHLAAQRQAWSEALLLIRQALALAPQQAEFHYALANILSDSGAAAAARPALEEAIRLRPAFFEAWNNLGLLCEGAGDNEAAENAFAQALALRPAALSARRHLARRYRLNGRHAQALTVCEAGLQQAPGEPALLREKIATLILLDRCDEAGALLTGCGMVEAPWRNLWHRLAQRLAATNVTAAAREIYRALAATQPDDWQARLGAALTLPVVPESVAALDAARAAYRQEMQALLAAVTLAHLAEAPESARCAAAARDNFYLAYHGQVDLDLQQQYAELLRRLLAGVQDGIDAAGRSSPRSAAQPCAERRGRIGFVSAFIRDCTVGHYFRAWITGLAEAGFAVTVFSLDGRDDALTREIAAHGVPILKLAGDLPAQARALAAAAQAALIYPEIGMHGGTQALAALRLAPLQCAAWGHPISSGLASIDVYFSSALMEPAHGEAHYAEALYRLPGLGTAYRAPEQPPPAGRQALGLPEDVPLLFYPHSLFKIHPADDALLLEVLRRNPAAGIVLFESEYAGVTRAYRQRLAPQLAAAGMAADRLHFLPLMPRERYLQVARCCQVMLDCRYWSGGNTTLDALTVGLPVVAWPGESMRSRQSAGMLQAMGMEALIAGSIDEVWQKVSRLLGDAAWQAEMSAGIARQRHRLFDDPAPVAALVAGMTALIGDVPENGK